MSRNPKIYLPLIWRGSDNAFCGSPPIVFRGCACATMAFPPSIPLHDHWEPSLWAKTVSDARKELLQQLKRELPTAAGGAN